MGVGTTSKLGSPSIIGFSKQWQLRISQATPSTSHRPQLFVQPRGNRLDHQNVGGRCAVEAKRRRSRATGNLSASLLGQRMARKRLELPDRREEPSRRLHLGLFHYELQHRRCGHCLSLLY